MKRIVLGALFLVPTMATAQPKLKVHISADMEGVVGAVTAQQMKVANLSWELKRLQTPWFDGVGQNKIKPRRKEPRWEVCYVRSRNARSRVVWVRSRW